VMNRLLLLVLVAPALACGTRPGGAGSVSRDSAGVEIVETGGPGWSEGWTVAETSSIDIGGNAADSSYDLNQVSGAVRLGDGRVVVANGETADLRFYDRDGKYLFTSGRRGQGPGEYQMLMGLWRLPGDSLIASDLMARRLTVVGPDGALVRTFSLGGEAGLALPTNGRMSLATPVGVFGDGSIIGMVLDISLEETREAWRDSVNYIRYGPDGAVQDTIARLPGIEMTRIELSVGDQTLPSPMPVPLGRQTVPGVGMERFYDAQNARFEFEVRDRTGRIRRLVRMPAESRPITAADREAHRQAQLEQLANQPGLGMVPAPLLEQFRQRITSVEYPETFPFIEELREDGDGNLWVREVGAPGDERARYAVFDGDGAFLGRLTLPARFRPTHIAADEILGIWRDADDVQHVRGYPLIKP